MVPLDEMSICEEYSTLSFGSSEGEYSGIGNLPGSYSRDNEGKHDPSVSCEEMSNWAIMQSTGLTDKSEPCAEVFEGDIVSPDGRVIGNQWENPSLLEDGSNLLIEGLGTAAWIATHKKAMARGLSYPKRHAD